MATETILSTGGANYTTMDGWESATSGDLSTGEAIRVGEVQSGHVDSTNVDLAGSTNTDATHYRHLLPAAGFEWNPLTEVGAQTTGHITVTEDFVRVEHFRVSTTSSNAIIVTGDNLYLNACQASCTGASQQPFKFTSDNSVVVNCLATDGGGGTGATVWGFRALSPSTGTSFVNCVAYGITTTGTTANGFKTETGTTITVKNCIAWGTTAATTDNDFSLSGTPTNTNNLSGDATATGTGSINSTTWMTSTYDLAAIFRDAANNDFHLQAEYLDLYTNTETHPGNNGTDITGLDSRITTDFDGNTMPSSQVHMGIYQGALDVVYRIGSGGNGAAISNWEADTDIDLVTPNERHIGELINNAAYAEQNIFVTATTDATRYRMLRNEAGEEPAIIGGTMTGGHCTTASSTAPFRIDEDYFRMVNVGAVSSNASGNGFLFVARGNGDPNGVIFDSCVGQNTGAGACQVFGNTSDFTGGTITFRNCIAFNTGAINDTVTAAGWAVDVTSTQTTTVLQNCAAYGFTNAGSGTGIGVFLEDTGVITATNCWSMGNDVDWQGTSGTITDTNCVSVDGTEGTTARVLADEIEDAANANFHLTLTSNLRGVGTDLSSSFDWDFYSRDPGWDYLSTATSYAGYNSRTRGQWDIGPISFEAATTTTTNTIGTGDYTGATAIADWEAATDVNLTPEGSDIIYIGELTDNKDYAEVGINIGTGGTDSHTTGAHYRHLRAQSNNEYLPIRGTGARSFGTNTDGHILIKENNFRLSSIGFKLTNTTTSSRYCVEVERSRALIDSCVFFTEVDGRNNGVLVWDIGALGCRSNIIRNCIAYSTTPYSQSAGTIHSYIITTSAVNTRLENCLSYNHTSSHTSTAAYGFRSAGATTTTYVNCLSVGNGVDYSGEDADETFTTCFSSDGTEATTSITVADEFAHTDLSTNDFYLRSDSSLLSAGTDLNSGVLAFSDDFYGNARTGAWEIGPIQYNVNVNQATQGHADTTQIPSEVADLATWESGVGDDIDVEGNDRIVAAELSSATHTVAVDLNIPTGVVDQAHYRIVRTASGAEYVPHTDVGAKLVVNNGSSAGTAITVEEDYARVLDFYVSFQTTNTGTLNAVVDTLGSMAGLVFENMFMVHVGTAGRLRATFNMRAADSAVLRNCIFTMSPATTNTNLTRGFWQQSTSATPTLYNCASYKIVDGSGTGRGIQLATGGVAENCIAVDSDLNDFTGVPTGNNNLSSDDTADDSGGTGHVVDKKSRHVFNGADSNDFRLREVYAPERTDKSAAYQAGTTQSSFDFTFDRSITRTSLGTWSMGPYSLFQDHGGTITETKINTGGMEFATWLAGITDTTAASGDDSIQIAKISSGTHAETFTLSGKTTSEGNPLIIRGDTGYYNCRNTTGPITSNKVTVSQAGTILDGFGVEQSAATECIEVTVNGTELIALYVNHTGTGQQEGIDLGAVTGTHIRVCTINSTGTSSAATDTAGIINSGGTTEILNTIVYDYDNAGAGAGYGIRLTGNDNIVKNCASLDNKLNSDYSLTGTGNTLATNADSDGSTGTGAPFAGLTATTVWQDPSICDFQASPGEALDPGTNAGTDVSGDLVRDQVGVMILSAQVGSLVMSGMSTVYVAATSAAIPSISPLSYAIGSVLMPMSPHTRMEHRASRIQQVTTSGAETIAFSGTPGGNALLIYSDMPGYINVRVGGGAATNAFVDTTDGASDEFMAYIEVGAPLFIPLDDSYSGVSIACSTTMTLACNLVSLRQTVSSA